MRDDFLPNETEGDDERQQKALEIASLYRETFSTPAGQRVLELMTQYLYIDTPAGADLHRAGHDEGKRQLVRMIHRQIRLAETGGSSA